MFTKLINLIAVTAGIFAIASSAIAFQVYSGGSEMASPYSNCSAGWCDYTVTTRSDDGTLTQTTTRVYVGN